MAESKKATKTIEAWEKERGVIIPDADVKSKVTEQEFVDMVLEKGVGVNFEDRIKFLKDNSYPVTRENMIDSSLSVRV